SVSSRGRAGCGRRGGCARQAGSRIGRAPTKPLKHASTPHRAEGVHLFEGDFYVSGHDGIPPLLCIAPTRTEPNRGHLWSRRMLRSGISTATWDSNELARVDSKPP